MIIKKEQLSLYKMAHTQWNKDLSRINIEFPNAEKIIPKGMDVQDAQYKWYELQYASWCIKNIFMSDFKISVEYADKMEFKRSQEDWWKSLSPYDFEKETGNWFLNKGMNSDILLPLFMSFNMVSQLIYFYVLFNPSRCRIQ